MHELSVCRFLINKAEEIAQQEQATRVTQIGVHVGPLAGIDPDLLKEAFRHARVDSMAAQAELQVTELPLRIHCRQCGAESEVSPSYLVCGLCGSQDTKLISGDELMLANLEFED